MALLAPRLGVASRTSTDYSMPAEGYDSAGAVLSSANYSVKGSNFGVIAALTSVSSPSIINKSGYVGQLYEIQGLSITAPPPNNLNETTSRQLKLTPHNRVDISIPKHNYDEWLAKQPE
jgi:hypothetical protein